MNAAASSLFGGYAKIISSLHKFAEQIYADFSELTDRALTSASDDVGRYAF